MPFTSRAGRALFISACLVLVGTYLLAIFTPAAGTYHDDGLYLVTARALAEGKGYRIISMPGEPFQTKYPILVPWLISLLWRVYPTFPDNLPLLRLVGLASLGVWLTLSWRLLWRLGLTRDAAWITVLLVAASPSVLFVSTHTMAEMPFGACLAAGLLLLARIHDGDERRHDGALAGLFMGLSVLSRAIGVTGALGGLLALAVARRWRLAAEYAVGVLVTVAPWTWWVMQHNRELAAIDTYYAASNYGAWNIITNYPLAEKIRVLVFNVVYAGMAPALFWDIAMPVWWAVVVAVLLFFVLGRGLWLARSHPVAWVMAAYLGTVLCWVWPPLRFLTPVAPGIAWLVVAGTPRAATVVKALALVIGLASAFQLWGQTVERLEKRSMWPVSGAADSWPAVEPLLEWIARETPPDAILTGNLDPQYFLYTGRKAIRAFSADAFALFYGPQGDIGPLGTVEDFRRRLLATGATYLVMTPSAGFGEAPYLRALVSTLQDARPLALSVATGSVETGYMVYAIHRAQLADPVSGPQ